MGYTMEKSEWGFILLLVQDKFPEAETQGRIAEWLNA